MARLARPRMGAAAIPGRVAWNPCSRMSQRRAIVALAEVRPEEEARLARVLLQMKSFSARGSYYALTAAGTRADPRQCRGRCREQFQVPGQREPLP